MVAFLKMVKEKRVHLSIHSSLISSNSLYSNIADWPDGLKKNENFLHLVESLSLLSADEVFNLNLIQHEMNIKASLRSFEQ